MPFPYPQILNNVIHSGAADFQKLLDSLDPNGIYYNSTGKIWVFMNLGYRGHRLEHVSNLITLHKNLIIKFNKQL
jgi:hypothetical protein